MKELTAQNLKQALWETLNGVKGETIEPHAADAVATQAREILRTVNTQIRITSQAKRQTPKQLIDFSED